ncbi:MAG: VOC family protein [Beutenbergiaceae bacterium]
MTVASPAGEAAADAIPLDAFAQLCLVVEDVEAAIASWCTVLDVPRSDLIELTTPAQLDPHEQYRGENANYGLKIAVIQCAERGFILELIEPDQNPSTFREFLDKHGNGLHHIGFVVGDARDAIVAQLETSGYPIRNLGVQSAGSWTVLEGEDILGTNINIKPTLGL